MNANEKPGQLAREIGQAIAETFEEHAEEFTEALERDGSWEWTAPDATPDERALYDELIEEARTWLWDDEATSRISVTATAAALGMPRSAVLALVDAAELEPVVANGRLHVTADSVRELQRRR